MGLVHEWPREGIMVMVPLEISPLVTYTHPLRVEDEDLGMVNKNVALH